VSNLIKLIREQREPSRPTLTPGPGGGGNRVWHCFVDAVVSGLTDYGILFELEENPCNIKTTPAYERYAFPTDVKLGDPACVEIECSELTRGQYSHRGIKSVKLGRCSEPGCESSSIPPLTSSECRNLAEEIFELDSQALNCHREGGQDCEAIHRRVCELLREYTLGGCPCTTLLFDDVSSENGCSEYDPCG